MPELGAAQTAIHPSVPRVGWSALADRRADADKKANQALFFGILSFVFDPLFIPTIIAISYGAKSLRAGTARRGRAIAGLTLGIAGVVTALVGAAIWIPLFLALHHAAAAASLESSITAGMAEQGIALTDVACPAAASTAQGTTITCTGQQSGRGAVRLDVVFTDSQGHYSVTASRAG